MRETLEKTEGMIKHLEAVTEILEKFKYDKTKIIPILQRVQEVCKYLPKDVISFVATSLRMPPARVYGVATFYAHFSLEPKGRHVIKLCDGTACHVKKSTAILDALREKLGLSEEKKTTPDMMFTVETVSCLGACGLAPVMLVDDEVHGQVTPARALEIVEEIKAGDEAAAKEG